MLQKISFTLLWYITTTGHLCRIAEKLPLTQYPLRHIHRASKNAQALSRLSSGGDQRSVSHILRALPTFFVSISECLGAGAFLLFNAIHKFCQLHCFFSHFLERIHIHGSELFCSKFLLSLYFIALISSNHKKSFPEFWCHIHTPLLSLFFKLCLFRYKRENNPVP